MIYDYDKNFIKENLTIEQVAELVEELGGEPQFQNNYLICKTICHHSLENLGEASHKLYYYDNSKLFHCFTACGESFDIFDLILRIQKRENDNYQLPQAVEFVAQYFGYTPNKNREKLGDRNKNLEYFEKYDKIQKIKIETQEIELKEYDEQILKFLPRPIILSWINDNISKEIMDYYEICFNPKNYSIIIPHRDINGRLVGIRERNLIPENIEQYGKYRPAYIGNKMYNHPLSFNLYGLYQNKENIKKYQKAIIVEGEKSVLQYGTMFGQENNITVAVCGAAFITYQFWLLMQLGVKEIIIGLDKQFQEKGDEEFKRLTKNLKNIHKKYGKFINISLLFDKHNLLDYKDSPTDKGKEKFLQLFKERINLYERQIK